jgi:hypothetical protein
MAWGGWPNSGKPFKANAVVCGGYQGPGDVIPGAVIGAALRAWSASTCGHAFANVGVSGVSADMLTSASTGAIVPQTINGTVCPNASLTICVVNKWYDQTVSGDCSGSCDFVQDSTEQRGILTTTCPSPLTVCILYPGSAATYLQTAANMTMTFPATAMAVATYSIAGGDPAGTYIGFNYGGFIQHETSANTLAMTCSSTGSPSSSYATTDSTFYSLLGLCGTSSYNLYLNGAAGTAGSWTSSVMAGQPYVGDIGANANIYETEAGIWLSDVSASASALSANQRSYWGF